MSNKEQNKDQLWALRHSTEHVLTQAMLKLYPGLKMAMGPATDEGFYFDFDLPIEIKISEEDLPKIEAEMQKIIKADLPIIKKEISLAEARELFKNNEYKQEWLDEIEERGEKPTVYWTADQFVDLCAGPHVKATGEIKSFKLMKIAGAYWHGDEKNKMLTRIYGTAFTEENDLQKYLEFLTEAEKRDHRKLGKEFDLFTFSDLVGSGLPLYTPKGTFIRQTVNNYVEEMQTKKDYTQVWTPQIAKAKLFQISGHYDKYKDGMFKVVSNYSEEEFFLKPMNCPQHTQIYLSQPRSYRDLPLRFTDFAMLYRDEKPGELSGLARVRSFSQDDCHIFCREDQVDEEIDTALTMTKKIMATFGFKYRYRLSTRDVNHPEKYLGDPKIWDKVEKWAEKIMKRNKIDYFDGPGEAAFYAPKMDLMATDALGREWQLSTVQIDFVMPERFGLEYTDKDGAKKRPVMLHRAIVGSPERFLMILIEHYAGAFPLWLSPVQVVIISVSEAHIEHCQKLAKEFKDNNVHVEVWGANETVGNKIRKAIAQKIPYMLVIGDKEMSSENLHVRARGSEKVEEIDRKEFIAKIKQIVADKSVSL